MESMESMNTWTHMNPSNNINVSPNSQPGITLHLDYSGSNKSLRVRILEFSGLASCQRFVLRILLHILLRILPSYSILLVLHFSSVKVLPVTDSWPTTALMTVTTTKKTQKNNNTTILDQRRIHLLIYTFFVLLNDLRSFIPPALSLSNMIWILYFIVSRNGKERNKQKRSQIFLDHSLSSSINNTTPHHLSIYLFPWSVRPVDIPYIV